MEAWSGRIRSVFAAWAAVLVLAAIACGSGSGADGSQDNAAAGTTPTPAVTGEPGALQVIIHLSEPSGEFQVGEAVLREIENGTEISLGVAPPEPGAQPIHIHTGSCNDVGDVVHALENVVAGRSATVLDVPLSELLVAGRLINIHLSFSDFGTYMACGQLPDLS